MTINHPHDLIPDIARQRAAELRKEQEDPRRRVAIIGISGSGKTYSVCTTFPSVVPLDYDNQIDDKKCLAAIAGYYPMWNSEFVERDLKINGTPVQRCIAVLRLLKPHLNTKHTIFIDSGSTFGDFIMVNLEQREQREGKTKSGAINDYWIWNQWADAWREICTEIKHLPCNVAVAFHESEIRDETTGRLEKFGISMPGKKFTPRFPQFFTDVVRATHVVKPNKDGSIEKEEWLWQIKPTLDFPMAKSRCSTSRMQISASWTQIIQ
jgi:hypothetical protein